MAERMGKDFIYTGAFFIFVLVDLTVYHLYVLARRCVAELMGKSYTIWMRIAYSNALIFVEQHTLNKTPGAAPKAVKAICVIGRSPPDVLVLI